MLLTLVLVVFFFTVVMAFSQEFYGLFKKIAAIKGAPLVLPLAVASWIVFNLDYWLLWAVYYVRECLQVILGFLNYLIPFKQAAASIVLILFLTVISVVPVFFLDLYLNKKKHITYHYPYAMSAIIWIIVVMLSFKF
jgi:hypothetical protein